MADTLAALNDVSGTIDVADGDTGRYSWTGTLEDGTVAIERQEGRSAWRVIGTSSLAEDSGRLIGPGKFRVRLAKLAVDDTIDVTLDDVSSSVRTTQGRDGSVIESLDEFGNRVDAGTHTCAAVILPAAGYVLLGADATVGTWRVIRDGDDLAFQRYEEVDEVGTWVEKLLVPAVEV